MDNDQAKLDERIIRYINQELKKGFSSEIIKENLVKAGHNPVHIDLHFKSIEKEIEKRPRILVLLLIFFIVVSLVSLSFNIIFYQKIPIEQRYKDLVFEGKDLCTKGEYDKAFKKLEKAMELDKDTEWAYSMYGRNAEQDMYIELARCNYQ